MVHAAQLSLDDGSARPKAPPCGSAASAAIPAGTVVAYYQPIVFTDAHPAQRISQEEIFGPVLTVLVFDGDDHAVEIANGTPYGLAAGLHTRDITRAHPVAQRLRAGFIWINTWGRFENYTPFAGYKASGYGRELGPEGIEEYLQYKTVYVDAH
jgi:aldehyde dehydrogenase (NAD+)